MVSCVNAQASRVRRNFDPQLLPRTSHVARCRRSAGLDPIVVGRCPREIRTCHQPRLIGELSLGIPERSAERLTLINDLPLLTIEDEIAEIVDIYIQHKVMPADPSGDALHLAIASFHKCDFLVTWNCRHIANANKFGHIRRINTSLGLFIPALVTPLALLGVDHESNA